MITLKRNKGTERHWSWHYQLLVQDSTRAEIRQPSYWDHDDFEIELTGGFKELPDLSDVLVPDGLWDWLSHHVNAGTLSALHALPPGDYLLIKSPLVLQAPNWLSIGNDGLDPPPGTKHIVSHSQTFSEHEHIPLNFTSYALGMTMDEAKEPFRTFVGLGIQRYSMSRDSFGALFFPVGHQASSGSEHPEHLLILPNTGELVIDFATDWENTGMDWATAVRSNLCDLLTGEEPKARRPRKRRKT